MKLVLIALVVVLFHFSIQQNEHFRNRIYNGEEIFISEAPYLVMIDIFKNKTQYLCSGALISHNYVITAAHCITPDTESVTVHLGKDDLRKIQKNELSLTCSNCYKSFNSDGKYAKRDQEGRFYINDIGLINLPQYVRFIKDQISPVLLPSYKDLYVDLVGQEATVAAWGKIRVENPFNGTVSEGYPDHPMATKTPILDQDTCILIFSGVHEPFDPDNQFCTSHLNTGTCHGDSGGPLVVNEKLFGIVSGGTLRNATTGDKTLGCSPNYGDSFTRVSKFLKWISDNSDVTIGWSSNKFNLTENIVLI